MPHVWEKWLWCERGLNFAGSYMGKLDGYKPRGCTFLLNFGCQMEPFAKPLLTGEFPNFACRLGMKHNFENIAKT